MEQNKTAAWSGDTILSPSLMCADMDKLDETVKELSRLGANCFHVDIMDGKFVPNTALEPEHIKSLRGSTRSLFEAHLMVSKPEDIVERVAECGADIITIHHEATKKHSEILRYIRTLGKRSGIALNPETSISAIQGYIDDLDMITIMCVRTGFAGGKFIESALAKVKKAKDIVGGRPIRIQVDGNVGPHNVAELCSLGANSFVLGTAGLFRKEKTYKTSLEELKALLTSVRKELF